MPNSPKIIFWGTPDFAVPSLIRICENDFPVSAVVTVPDREQGRGQKEIPSPVKQQALRLGIPVLQPDSFDDAAFLRSLQDFAPDLFVIVAFKILPAKIFTLPRIGSFNLHASLLPKYRGAAPIQWALINGDTETGVTTFFLQEKVDTGNILLQCSAPIIPEDNFGTLHDSLALLGADVVLETIRGIAAGTLLPVPQPSAGVSKAPKITKEMCALDFNKPAAVLHNLVRGISPKPGAHFLHGGKLFKITKTQLCSSSNLTAGEIKQLPGSLMIGCGEGAISILEIQPEGRKKMTVAEFLRGYSFIDTGR